MKALHVNSTEPFIQRGNKKENYYIEDFTLLTTILSALKWREHNGSIKMYTDKLGYDYYSKLGLLSLWDLGVDYETLESVDGINFDSFWAAGKIFTLQKEKTPTVLIDTDFIAWDKVDLEGKIKVIHKEDIVSCYKPAEYLKIRDGYEFNSEWDWEERPCNGAFMYFGDEDFKNKYVDESIDFMLGNLENADHPGSQMIFAEQRLLSMVAKYHGVDIKVFKENPEELKGQKLFTHIWGAKEQIKKDEKLKSSFCKRCINRIRKDFPEWIEIISNIDSLKEYM